MSLFGGTPGIDNLALPGPRPWIDVTAPTYGADPTGATDSAAAINAALAAAEAVAAGGAFGCLVYLPAGQYRIDSSVDMSEMSGVTVMGAGYTASIIRVNYAGVGIDMTGAQSCTLYNFGVQGIATATIACLIAKSNTRSCTAIVLEDMSINAGGWTVASLYVYGATDCDFRHSIFGTNVNGSNGVILTSTNVNSITSPRTTIATGTQITQNHGFWDCEFHDQTAAFTNTVRLDAVIAIRFFGGPFSASGNAFFQVTGICRHILIEGVNFYSDSGTTANYTVYADTGADIRGLGIHHCLIQVANSIIGGVASAPIRGLTIFGNVHEVVGGAGSFGIMTMTAAADPTIVYLRDSLLMCDGHNLTPTGSIADCLIMGPGTISLPSSATMGGVIVGSASAGGAKVFGTAGLTIDSSGAAITKHLSATVGWDPGSLANATQTTVSLGVPGAALGDTVAVGFTQVLSGMMLTGQIIAADTGMGVLYNGTGTAGLNVSSGVLRFDVWKH